MASNRFFDERVDLGGSDLPGLLPLLTKYGPPKLQKTIKSKKLTRPAMVFEPVTGMATNISTAWNRSTSIKVQRRPILSESVPARMRPPALPTAMMATATNAMSPMLFLAMPLMLPMTISPALVDFYDSLNDKQKTSLERTMRQLRRSSGRPGDNS